MKYQVLRRCLLRFLLLLYCCPNTTLHALGYGHGVIADIKNETNTDLKVYALKDDINDQIRNGNIFYLKSNVKETYYKPILVENVWRLQAKSSEKSKFMVLRQSDQSKLATEKPNKKNDLLGEKIQKLAQELFKEKRQSSSSSKSEFALIALGEQESDPLLVVQVEPETKAVYLDTKQHDDNCWWSIEGEYLAEASLKNSRGGYLEYHKATQPPNNPALEIVEAYWGETEQIRDIVNLTSAFEGDSNDFIKRDDDPTKSQKKLTLPKNWLKSNKISIPGSAWRKMIWLWYSDKNSNEVLMRKVNENEALIIHGIDKVFKAIGVGDRVFDVSVKLNNLIKKEPGKYTLTLPKSWSDKCNLLGDPWPGVQKKLKLVWRENGQEKRREFDENEEVNLGPIKPPAGISRLEDPSIKALFSADGYAWTGFLDVPSKESDETKLILERDGNAPEPDRTNPNKTINAGASLPAGYKLKISRNPELHGTATQNLTINETEVVNLPPLHLKGFAWIDQPFKENTGTLFFQAQAQKTGNTVGPIVIALSTKKDMQPKYCILIGAGENNDTAYVIDKNGRKIVSVTKQQNKNVAIIPSIYAHYWVSFNNGFFRVGKGIPGDGVIMSWYENQSKAQETIAFVGFGSDKSETSYGNIRYWEASLEPIVPPYSYIVKNGEVNGIEEQLSPEDDGTVSFTKDDKQGQIRVIFTKKDTQRGYEIELDEETLKIKRVPYQNKAMDLLYTTLIPSEGRCKIWVSYYKGLILAGRYKLGQENSELYPFIMWQDNTDHNKISGISQIALYASGTSISDFRLYPSVHLDLVSADKYTKPLNTLNRLNQSLTVYSPFKYRFFQNDGKITMAELFSNESWHIAKTPQADATYDFAITIKKDGIPQIELNGKKESQELEAARHWEKINIATSKATYTAAEKLKESVSDSIIGSIIGATYLGSIAAGMGTSIEGAKNSTLIEEIEKSEERYIRTDVIARAKEAKSSHLYPEKLSSIKTTIESLTKEELSPNNVKALTTVISETDVRVDQSIKNNLHAYSEKVIQECAAIDNDSEHYDQLKNALGLLAAIYVNPYILDQTNPKDKREKLDLAIAISTIFQQVKNHEKSKTNGFTINDMKGESLWLKEELPIPNKGSVSFEVKALSDVFITLAEDPFTLYGQPKMYEIALSMTKNKPGQQALVTQIHRTPLGQPVITFQNDALNVSKEKYKKFWINVDNGIITIGKNELTPANKICEWTDCYANASNKINRIGFSNWDGSISLRNIVIGKSINEQEEEKREKDKTLEENL